MEKQKCNGAAVALAAFIGFAVGFIATCAAMLFLAPRNVRIGCYNSNNGSNNRAEGRLFTKGEQ